MYVLRMAWQPHSQSKLVIASFTIKISCVEVKTSQIMKNISILSVNEIKEPVDYTIFHIVHAL